MTDLMTTDHADSGEIPCVAELRRVNVGETRMRIDTGEKTQRIDPRILDAPSYEAIPRRVIEIDDTVQFRIPETIGVVDFDGPQKPPPPLPKPKDLAETEQIRQAYDAKHVTRREAIDELMAIMQVTEVGAGVLLDDPWMPSTPRLGGAQ
jgi:hypothetical protein